MVKGGINLVSNGNILVKSHPKSIITTATASNGTIFKEGKYFNKNIVVLQVIRLNDDQCIVELVYKEDYGKSTE